MSALRVTVVCSGNICRSPMGEVMLRDAVERAGLGHAVTIDSAGIGGWHVGDGADRRALAVLRGHGYDGTEHRVRQITRDWFDDPDTAPDLLLAMDRGHYDDLLRLAPDADVRMLRSFDPALEGVAPEAADLDVPDPYYGELSDYETVFDMVEAATPALITHLQSQL